MPQRSPPSAPAVRGRFPRRRARGAHFASRALLLAAGVALLAGCAAGAGPARGNDPRAAMLVAEVAVSRGQYLAAIDEYRRAAAVTGDPALAERAARIAFEHGQHTALERVAREWAARDPKAEVARRFQAVALLRLGRVAEAEAEFAWLLTETYPSPAEGFAALAQSLDDLDDDAAAAAVLAGLAARWAEVPEGHFAAAQLLLQAGNSPAALAALARAQALRPEWREALWLEARARVAGGDCERGLAQSGGLAAEAPDGDRLLHAWLMAACDRIAEARPIFEDLARGRTLRAEALESLAGLELEAGRYDEAVRLYGEIVQAGRAGDRTWLALGQLAERRDRDDDALRFYERVTTGRFAPAAQLRAYRLRLQRGDAAAAANALDAYVSAVTDRRAVITAARAQALAEHGRAPEAYALLARAQATYPDADELRYARAFILEDDGRVDEALRVLRGVLARRPDDAIALNAVGFTLADHRRSLPEAERLIRAALAIRPDSYAIQDSLGWVLHRRGRSREALDWLARAHARSGDPEIAAHLGEVHWALGDRATAERTWREALAKEPEHRRVHEAVRNHLGADAVLVPPVAPEPLVAPVPPAATPVTPDAPTPPGR